MKKEGTISESFALILEILFSGTVCGLLCDGDPSLEAMISGEEDADVLLHAIALARQRLKELSLKEEDVVEYRYGIPDSIEVTGDYRIIFNGKEIPLSPLCKTVYILFLNHPEGVRIKELSDYRGELENIYSHLRPDRPHPRIVASVDRLIDGMGMYSNEKISRIKKILSERFSGTTLEKILITGERGEPLKVRIFRKSVKRGDDLEHYTEDVKSAGSGH